MKRSRFCILAFGLLLVGGCAKNAQEVFEGGYSAYRKGDADKAIAQYTEAIRLDPKLTGAYYNRGFAYDKLGEHDKAIADFSEAIRLNPRDAGAYYNRGIAYQKKGDYGRAQGDFDQARTLGHKAF
jgi:tetratricopeptide (TPR) repeat protein